MGAYDHIASREGTVSWVSPSNIALVKYWGKKGIQTPSNPSVSMTLSRSVTVMEIDYQYSEKTDGPWLEFFFDGRKNDQFQKKILDFLTNLSGPFSFLENLQLVIKSRNTFPHSAGIASSASSMSALALCLISLKQIFSPGYHRYDDFYREASDLARQASGSASRSVYGGYNLWGHHPAIHGSDDHYAIPLPGEVHPVFRDMKDAILLVSSAKKSVSSRAGHGLMEDHPFSSARYKMASQNALEMVNILNNGDMDTFIGITEQEALVLHALMMSSHDPFILLREGSLKLIELIRQFRKETAVPVCFTIDAGPNIHLLYPGENETKVKDWIQSELTTYLENGQWIDDQIGGGPENLNE